MKKALIQTHEAWLAMIMAGFMSKSENKQVLFDFSDILFRHFNWMENELVEAGVGYSYDREPIPIKVDKLSHMLTSNIVQRLDVIDEMLSTSPDEDLNFRVLSDIKYMKTVLNDMEDEEVTAFSTERTFPGISLTEEATDALTLFLFEETYKEYELIMIYNYLKAHSKDAYLNRIFQILIDESFFHLRRFGDMGAKMGILAVPRIIMKELYQVEDVVQFLHDGIDEELAAKEECKKLSEAVAKDSPELERFFDFINHQENYHIALMKDASGTLCKGSKWISTTLQSFPISLENLHQKNFLLLYNIRSMQAYVKLMGLDMSEFREPSTYKTLNKLFTRALEEERKMPRAKTALISGVDALITDFGTIAQGKAYQIKGMEYSIEKLFGEHHQAAASWLEEGTFMNFYLSPKDYHRYHMPMSLKDSLFDAYTGETLPCKLSSLTQ